MRTPKTRRKQAAAAAVFAAAPIALTGCFISGGDQSSNDQFTYKSTVDLPQTVTIHDTRDGTMLFRYEVPVGRKLILDFNEGVNRDEDPAFPDELRWDDIAAHRVFAHPQNRLMMPPAEGRRIFTEIRERPEAVPEFVPVPPSVLEDPEAEGTSDGG